MAIKVLIGTLEGWILCPLLYTVSIIDWFSRGINCVSSSVSTYVAKLQWRCAAWSSEYEIGGLDNGNMAIKVCL